MEKPEIRFKGYTDEWEQRKLGDVLDDMYNGQTPSRNKSQYWNGNIKWLSSGELNRGTVYDSIETITEDGQKSANLRIVPKGTFIMAITGLEAVGTRGNCALLGFDTTLNQSCMALFPKKDLLTSDFLFQWYGKVGEEYGLNYTQGTKQQSYNAELIKILPISLPSVAEQKKIASYLSNLDHLITLHQRKCDEVKSLKKYMLQKMFPQNEQKVPEIRFEGFTEAWEQRKLIEVCDYVDYRGKTPTKTEDGIFLVTAKNVKDGFIDYETSKEYISENAYEEVMRRGKPEIGDVLITTEAPCGNVAQVNKADIALAQRIIKYRGHIGVVDNTYLKHYLLSPEFQKILNAKSSGGTVQGIKGSILHQQKIIYPSYEEQKKIGQHMDSLDHLITLHQRKPIPNPNHPIIHTKHKGEEKYVRIRVNDREKTNRTANLWRFPVDIPGGFKDGGGSVGEFQIYSGAE